MRNLQQYPITYGEVVDSLQNAQLDYYNKYAENIGGTCGLALLLAEQFIRKHKEQFDGFVKLGPQAE